MPEKPGGGRKAVLVRLDPRVHDALQRWARDELRSFNAQVEFVLRRALQREGRLPKGDGPPGGRDPESGASDATDGEP